MLAGAMLSHPVAIPPPPMSIDEIDVYLSE
jgi:hypothetical protein